MPDNEFYGLERDKRGNIQELYYWNSAFSPDQVKQLTTHDIKIIEEIKEKPGFLGLQLAMDY